MTVVNNVHSRLNETTVGDRYFTFGLSHAGFLGAYLRYAVVGAVVAALTALLLTLFVEGLGIDPEDRPGARADLLVPLSFLLSKRLAFRLSPAAA